MQTSIRKAIEKRFKKVKNILVIGVFGIEGESFLKFAREFIPDRDFSLYDRIKERLEVFDPNLKKATKIYELETIDYLKYDMIVRTPGFPKMFIPKEFHEKVVCNVSLFMEFVDRENVYTVTGTKGKSTTTTLLARFLENFYDHVILAGNIGIGILDFLSEINKNTVVVIEVSSFQAQDFRVSAKYCGILYTVIDHLDRHESLLDYHMSKATMLRYQSENDECVYFYDSKYSKEISDFSSAFKSAYSMDEQNLKIPFMYYDKANDVIHYIDRDVSYIITLESFKLPGEHNIQNLMMVLLLTKHLWKDKSDEMIRKYMSIFINFNGLPMHLEEIAEFKNVKIINDSYSVIPTATMAAIRSFNQGIVLIIGGESKLPKEEYLPLYKMINESSNIRQVIIFAKDSVYFEEGLRSINYHKISYANSMDELVEMAFSIADPFEIILFSPGAKSFDMFANFKERGRAFNEAVLQYISSESKLNL